MIVPCNNFLFEQLYAFSLYLILSHYMKMVSWESKSPYKYINTKNAIQITGKIDLESYDHCTSKGSL